MENEQEQPSQPQEAPMGSESKALAKKDAPRPLTPKNRSFLQHLANGRPTIESYKLAGYKGEAHAAYQLRSDLKEHLQLLLEQGGWSREQLALETNRLMALPLNPDIQNVNFKQKLDLLRFMDKALTPNKADTKAVKITPIVIAINKPTEVVIKEANEAPTE